MAGKRHHTIPQFLIRGFESSRRGSEVNVWLHRKGQKGIELNIRNVAAEQYFYGKPDETDLDERITHFETVLARLVDDLRVRPRTNEPVSDERIPTLVAHLALRTRQLRETASAAMASMLGVIKDHLGQMDVAKAFFAKELALEGETRDSFKVLLIRCGVSTDQIDTVMVQLAPYWDQIADNIMSLMGDTYKDIMIDQVSLYKRSLPEAARSGFIDSLSRNFAFKERSRLYSAFHWHVCHSSEALILGDSICIFETTGDRRFRPLDIGEGETVRIYVPLSARVVLVGSRGRSTPIVDFRLLCKAAARCSYEFFISSQFLSNHSHLVRGLGLWSGIVNQAEIDMFLKDFGTDLLRD